MMSVCHRDGCLSFFFFQMGQVMRDVLSGWGLAWNKFLLVVVADGW